MARFCTTLDGIFSVKSNSKSKAYTRICYAKREIHTPRNERSTGGLVLVQASAEAYHSLLVLLVLLLRLSETALDSEGSTGASSIGQTFATIPVTTQSPVTFMTVRKRSYAHSPCLCLCTEVVRQQESSVLITVLEGR
jgi:hypothetical protein